MFEKFAIVIEPNKEIDGDLVKLKKAFKKYSVNDYINHPNHLTLLHGFFQEDQLVKGLENIFFEPLTIETEKIKCFSQIEYLLRNIINNSYEKLYVFIYNNYYWIIYNSSI